MDRFYSASDDEIKTGETTDIYFLRTQKILEAKGLDKIRAVAEVTTGGLQKGWQWAVLCGIEEEASLLEGLPINVSCFPEGTIFRPFDYNGIRVPVLSIEGQYTVFATMETALLGFVCQASGVATAAARVRKAAGDKLVLSFGARRMHPAITPMISRSTYIGGLDGESCILGAKRIGINPTGTMPHSLIIMFGDQVKAWKAYDELMPPEVTRVALVDTYFDEKIESVMAAEALGKKLWGVRLDTPGSRRGSFEDIIKEVRWELDIRGYNYVKIFLSGGLNDESVKSLKEAGADGFGVGTWISNAPTVDFSMDVVEVEGKPVAKRGKFGGKKNIWRCRDCLIDIVLPADKPSPKCPKCGEQTESMLKPLIKNGKIVADLPKATEIRKYVLSQLDKVELNLITK